MGYPVTKRRFSELVNQALQELPDEFAEFLEEVPIEIHDFPAPEQLKAANVKQNGLLLGLYRGRPRTKRSVLDSAVMPDVIYIFQKPIEQVCHSEESLIRQVRTTVLHEIGHHFGMNEDDLARLGYG
jgi:predicted Zn-dependent protease with MMP-like domain